MKRQGTSKFVTELITNWLKEIRDPAKLDAFEKLIADRRKSLQIETVDEVAEGVVEALKNCKIGNKIYVVKPLPIKTTEDDMSNYARMDHTRMECRFWQYHPRKKILWVTVLWPTSREHHGKYFVCMNAKDIKRFLPSRTEPEVRVRNEQRRSR